MNNRNLPVQRDDLWGEIISLVRKQVSRKYLEKIKISLNAGLYDASINYIWDLVINDLRLKVEAYGVDIFISIEDSINYHELGGSLQDRWRDIPDHRLLSGCLKLNLISRTAFRHLSFWLSVRNHESAAHPIDEEEDVEQDTAIQCLCDAVRFVLSRHMPEPGLNLRVLRDNLKKRNLTNDREEIIQGLNSLSTEQCDSLLGMFVSIFIDGTPIAKKNILELAPYIWNKTTDNAKQRVGEKYAKYSAEGNKDKKFEIFSFLTIVDGIKYIPNQLRSILFKKSAQELIDAHFGWHNFYNELNPARQMAELGVDCPDDVLYIFMTAFLLSYVGNHYNVSQEAQPYLESLLKRFTLRHYVALIKVVRNSDQIQSEISSERPFRRLQYLCSKILPFFVSARHKQDCEFIIKNSLKKVIKRFMRE